MTAPQNYYFLGKNNSPQWIPAPCFETTSHELLKSTLKEKYDCGTKTSKICTEQKVLSFWHLKISKNCKISQQNNRQMRLDKHNQKKYEYICI